MTPTCYTSVAAYPQICSANSVQIKCLYWWLKTYSIQTNFVSAIQCDTCQIYKPCGPSNPQTCQNLCQHDSQKPNLPVDCVEGCFCANDTVLHHGKCIKPSECPCYLNGMLYEKDTFIIKDCQTWYASSS